jgi:hypothetical protein
MLLPVIGTSGNLSQPLHTSQSGATPPYHITLTSESFPHSLGDAHNFNASMILKLNQQSTVQILATCTSSLSLLSAVCAIYWFWMMRRNFRRDLVLLLILGGSWKSLWFVVFSAATFTQGTIVTETTFCQASGYMLQVGFEMCGKCCNGDEVKNWLIDAF